MEYDSDCNWFSVETYPGHKTAGESSLCLFVRARVFYFVWCAEKNPGLRVLTISDLQFMGEETVRRAGFVFQLIKMHRGSCCNKKK